LRLIVELEFVPTPSAQSWTTGRQQACQCSYFFFPFFIWGELNYNRRWAISMRM
jgi:hypothetical protein